MEQNWIKKISVVLLAAMLLGGAAAIAQTLPEKSVVKFAQGAKKKTKDLRIAGKAEKKVADTSMADSAVGPQPTWQQLQIRAIAGRVNQRAAQMMQTPEEIRYEKICYYWTDDSHTALGVSRQCDSPVATAHVNPAALVLPDSVLVDGVNYPLIEIGFYAFNNMSQLQGVVIPPTVRKIGELAFCDCDNLSAVALPETLEALPKGAFIECDRLNDIVLPHTVKSIGMFAFFGCRSLGSVLIPASVERIGEAAFADCQSLAHIDVADDNPSYVSVDGVLLGKDLSKLLQYPAGKAGSSYAMPGSVNSIGGGAFWGAKKLAVVGLSAMVRFLDFNTFCNCVSLANIDLPEGLQAIGVEAFKGCIGLKKVTLPTTLKAIGARAFDSCVVLAGFDLYNGLNTIGESAFRHCSAVTSVVLPESVASLGGEAFLGCVNLRSVALPNGLKEISPKSFFGCTGLSAIGLPENLAVVGDSAFFNCSRAGFLLMFDSLQAIGRWAFAGCRGLEDIDVPASVKTIGEGAFHGCDAARECHVGTVLPLAQAFDRPDRVTVYVPKGLKKEAKGSGLYSKFAKVKGE
ncbi:MAG: leucine-rich repeat domain-containing protein [Bacteroidales bacterium]|nr:leucine-rich repeat domain-containing protein [Bacteroidales bacterium]